MPIQVLNHSCAEISTMFPSLEDTASQSLEKEQCQSHLHRKSQQVVGRPYRTDSPL